MPTPSSLPAIAPTAMLGMNRPEGTWVEENDQSNLRRKANNNLINDIKLYTKHAPVTNPSIKSDRGDHLVK